MIRSRRRGSGAHAGRLRPPRSLAEVAARCAGHDHRELDASRRGMRALGVKSAFFGYGGYPGNTCISLNEEVVHGIPGPRAINAGRPGQRGSRRGGDGFIGDNVTWCAWARWTPSRALVRRTAAALRRAFRGAGRNRLGDVGHRCRRWPRPPDFPWCGTTAGTGWGASSTKSRRFPTTGCPARAPSCGPG